jgi:OmcA/MtrC family decaheme c-type cytochrome
MTAQLRIGRFAAVVFSGLLLLGLGGCDGSTGPAGPAGPPGPSGPPAFGVSPTGLNVTIDNVTVEDGRPVVEFSVVDQHGYYFAGLPSANFTIAKLEPGTGGSTDFWQSYVNRVETLSATAPRGPGAVDSALQATSENNVSGNVRGTLENHENGRYTYRFGNNLASVTYPGTSDQVGYEPNLTHRVGLQVTGSYRGATLPPANAAYTFVPATGATDGIADRRIATTETCNECHGRLMIHGNPGRVEVAYCVTCHNPGTTDANSGESLDMAVMVHRIHQGRFLPSVADGGMEYAIWGFGNSKHDYTGVRFPQDVRNCSTCHDAANEATPEAAHFTTSSTRESCGSCHDNVVFDPDATLADWQRHHPPTNNLSNEGCSNCHAPGNFADMTVAHIMPGKVAAQALSFNVLGVDTSTAGAHTVTFSVTENGEPIVLPGVFEGQYLTVRLNWALNGVVDYQHNRGVSVNVVNALRDGAATVSGPVDGVYTATLAATVPADASIVAAGIEGRGATAGGDLIPMTAAIEFFNADGTPATQPRREIVSMDTCATCHDTNEIRRVHSSYRSYEQPQYCVTCHNPVFNNGGDLKFLIHAVHASGFKTGDLPRPNAAAIEYPNTPSDCRACHEGNSFQLPLPAGVPVTRLAGSDASVITPQAAVCASCHDGALARAHMEQNGAQIARPIAEVADPTTRLPLPSVVETCATCHGPGKTADVRAVHSGLNR